MSLLSPNWNQPPLIAASGIVATALLPVLQKSSLSLSTIQFLQLGSYSLNVFATSQPGRLDGPQQDSMTNPKNDAADKQVSALSPGRRGRTLLAPKGWAFIIWAPIFAGELLYTVGSFFVKDNEKDLIRETSSGFIVAQVFQSLWAASFRPKYEGASSFISFAMLSGIAVSLSTSHSAICRHTNTPIVSYLLFGLPISLHFGWTTAASLVNLNGCIAMMDSSSLSTLRNVGHASAVAATVLGVVVTLSRQAPVYGGVIAWALCACADGMKTRLTELKDAGEADEYGAGVQKWLCQIGAGIVAAASVVTTAMMQQRK